MSRIVTERGQALGAAWEMWMFRIDVIVIIGRKHGIFAGPNRMMNRIVPAAAAQPRQGAMPSAVVPIGMADRSLSGAGIRDQQASENNANEHFGDRLHRIIRCAATGWKGK